MTTLTTLFPETQRQRRGHDFLPLSALEGVPELYATEDIEAQDKIVALHFFSASGDWWITEVCQSGEDAGLAFGYVRFASFPDGAEWGYTWLPELEEVNVHGGLVIVERDCYWSPVTFGQLKR
jgi:hypothetical protein